MCYGTQQIWRQNVLRDAQNMAPKMRQIWCIEALRNVCQKTKGTISRLFGASRRFATCVFDTTCFGLFLYALHQEYRNQPRSGRNYSARDFQHYFPSSWYTNRSLSPRFRVFRIFDDISDWCEARRVSGPDVFREARWCAKFDASVLIG